MTIRLPSRPHRSGIRLSGARTTYDDKLRTGLTRYDKLIEASGSSFADSSGNGNNSIGGTVPTLSNTAPPAGFTENAPTFNGTNQFIQFPSMTLAGVSYSYSVWIRTPTLAGSYPSVIFGATGGALLYIHQQSNGTISVAHAGSVVTTPATAITANTWYHLGVIYNSGTGIVTIYLNGAPVTSGAISAYAGTTPVVTTAKVSTGFWWNGQLYRERFYLGTVLSDKDMVSLSDSSNVVFSAAGQRTVVFDGNSLSVGYSGRIPHPTRINMQSTGNRLFYNVAVPGNTLTDRLAAIATVDAKYSASNSKNICVIWVESNDFAVSRTAAAVETDIQTYCAHVRATGFKVVVGSVCDRIEWTSTPAKGTQKSLYNVWLAANWSTFADGYFDPAGDARLASYLNATYFQGDGVHLQQAGYDVLAELAKPVIEAQ